MNFSPIIRESHKFPHSYSDFNHWKSSISANFFCNFFLDRWIIKIQHLTTSIVIQIILTIYSLILGYYKGKQEILYRNLHSRGGSRLFCWYFTPRFTEGWNINKKVENPRGNEDSIKNFLFSLCNTVKLANRQFCSMLRQFISRLWLKYWKNYF